MKKNGGYNKCKYANITNFGFVCPTPSALSRVILTINFHALTTVVQTENETGYAMSIPRLERRMQITKREAAIVSAYTGYLIGEFSDFQAYAEEVMGRPIFTHEFPYIAEELKKKSKKDFTSIKIGDDWICPYPLSM